MIHISAVGIYINPDNQLFMLLIKLGGSVITDKASYAVFKRENTIRLVNEIREGFEKSSCDGLIVVLGAGSFGHILAHEHSIHLGNRVPKVNLKAVSRIRRDVRELAGKTADILTETGFNPYIIPPEVIVKKEGDDKFISLTLNIKGIEKLARKGFVPLLFGDVVMDEEKLFSICSGDDVMEVLVTELDCFDNVAFMTNVDGIYSEVNGQKVLVENIEREELMDCIANLSVGEIKDVTGNMMRKALKIRSMAEKCGVWILNGNVPGRLQDLLIEGTAFGTRVTK